MVNTYTTSYQEHASATALNDGGFVVTWHSSDQDGDVSGIYGQRYDANGLAVDEEFQVNTYLSLSLKGQCAIEIYRNLTL